MKKPILLFMIVLGLALTMLACTTGRSQRYPRYPNYPPGGQGYPGYPGYPPGQNSRLEQVEILANHLKDATAEVTEEAKDTFLPQQDQDLANSTIATLEDLEKEANQFHENIDDRSQYRDPNYGNGRYGYPGYGDTRREQFTEVLQKYYLARKTLSELPAEDEVQKDFERVTSIMRNLTRLYGYRFDPDYDDLEPTIR